MLRKTLPLIVLAAMAGAAWMVSQNPPSVDRAARQQTPAMTVEIQPVQLESYPIHLRRYGVVQAAQRTTLMSEAAGQITYLADELRAGGRFKKGDLLLKLDDSKYRAELAIAQASLTESLQNYADQEAQAEQARKAWLLSGQSGEPSERILRVPQLKAAQAQVDSARSSVRLAKLTLDKSRVVAPFDGSVTSLAVELGQAISSGAQIAVLLSDKAPDIEVSLQPSDLSYLTTGAQPKVRILGLPQPFQGSLSRIAPEVDSASQQLSATVTLSPQTASAESMSGNVAVQWPRVGTLVEAEIEGVTLEDVMVIPNNAVYQSSYVYLVEQGRLKKQAVQLIWQDDANSVTRSGLKPGDQLVLTSLGQVATGTPVETSRTESSAEKQQ